MNIAVEPGLLGSRVKFFGENHMFKNQISKTFTQVHTHLNCVPVILYQFRGYIKNKNVGL
jgi:hypothetical protein